jgi:hypothetical protein
MPLPIGIVSAQGTTQEEREQVAPVKEIVVQREALETSNITDSAEGRVALERALPWLQEAGVTEELATREVYRVGDQGNPTYLTVPVDVILETVTIQEYADDSIAVHADYGPNRNSFADQTSPMTSEGISAQSSPYWQQYNSNCLTVDNNTGYITHCFYKSKLINDGDPNKDFWALERKGTTKSKSIYWMKNAWIDSSISSATNPVWYDWSPGQDEFHDPCNNFTVGINVEAAYLEESFPLCEQWDITFYPNEPGRFVNTWRGTAYRSERQVAFKIAISTSQGTQPYFGWSAGFWATP